MNIPTELYIQAQSHLPESGKHILAQQTTDRIVVYQAYNNEIANFALANGHFGGPKFSLERMSWIKPGFMWMMYRSGWATKPNQERVLAIYLGKERFEEILLRSVSTSFHSNSQYPNREDWNKALQTSDVLLQWDPDHDPQGGKLERRAVQVGLREGMRNACRACRLQQCLRAGMRYDPKTVKVTLDLLSESPLLERYHMGFRNFVSGEKSLFLMENPEAIFSNPEYKPMKLAQWMRMEWGSVSLLHTLCVNYFQPFNVLPYSKKVEILKQYWKYFQALYSSHLSSSAVPYFEKSNSLYNMVLHYRYYSNINTLREFFPKEARCDPDKVTSYCKPVMERASAYHAKYYDMKVTEMELIAMVAILFWNTVDKHNVLSAEMRHKRDAVFVEINSILLNSLGGINGSVRLGKIISFLHMTMDRAEEVNELWVMAKVFLPKFIDPYDANVWKDIVQKE